MIYLNNMILFIFCDDFGYCSGLCLWCHVTNDGYVYLNWLRSRLSYASDALLDLVQLCKLNFITMLLLLLLLTPSRLLGKWYDCCFIEWLCYSSCDCVEVLLYSIWSSAGRVGAALPGRAHLLQLLAQLGCCGVASSSLSLSPVTELLVCCLLVCITVLIASASWACYETGLVPKCFVPKFLSEYLLCLVNLHSMMQMAK
jgi:hypothetical protein